MTSDAGWTLALVMAGAGLAAIAAIATLLSGGGFLAAIAVYVLGGSVLVPAFATAPHAWAMVAPRRHPAARQAA